MPDEKLEGRGSSQLAKMIKNLGYNKDIDILLAVVTSPPPALKIKVDGMPIELDKDDLIVAERLTKHKRTVTITKTLSGSININNGATQDLTSLEFEADLNFDDELKSGDRVIVSEVADGQMYIILDRAVSY